jgi:hypothetical protein
MENADSTAVLIDADELATGAIHPDFSRSVQRTNSNLENLYSAGSSNSPENTRGDVGHE